MLTKPISRQSTKPFFLIAALAGILTLAAAGCTKKEKILVDGSSTVYPITEAVAEEYRKIDSSVHITVGISGTGGGFKKFCNGETHISDASREIKSVEIERCAIAKIQYLELPVAYDGLAVLVNKENDFVNQLNVQELNSIFRNENPVQTWQEINPAWPAEKIKIFSPGQDSGTFDYFVETIIGKKAKMRSDATFSEDDNVLVRGIAGEKSSIGFFGLAYYEENKDQLKLVPIVNPTSNEAVAPTLETVKSGQYSPLSRPIFIYVSKKGKDMDVVNKFVTFYLNQCAKLSKEVGYIPLPDAVIQENINKFNSF